MNEPSSGKPRGGQPDGRRAAADGRSYRSLQNIRRSLGDA